MTRLSYEEKSSLPIPSAHGANRPILLPLSCGHPVPHRRYLLAFSLPLAERSLTTLFSFNSLLSVCLRTYLNMGEILLYSSASSAECQTSSTTSSMASTEADLGSRRKLKKVISPKTSLLPKVASVILCSPTFLKMRTFPLRIL